MLKSYFKIAWRNLWKNKVFSAINIFGLSVGIAFAMLIGAYVWGELQVSRTLRNADDQYIIQSRWKDPNIGGELTGIADMPKSLVDNYPSLVANYYHWDGIATIVTKGDMHYRESMQIGDSTLLKMYGFKLLSGNASTALNDPFAVVITQKMALKYFSKIDVAGQTLSFENLNGDRHDFMITGVLAPLPKNSVTDLIPNASSDFFFPATAEKYFHRSLTGWVNAGTVNYVELRKGVDPKAVEKAMQTLMQKFETDAVIRNNLTCFLVKLTDYNLVSNGGLVKKMVYTLSGIALFILLMAVINFVNICIGRASTRMKEMGVRKVMGGMRRQLICQFLTESVLMVSIATLIALCVFLLARPYFGDMLGKDIPGIFDFPAYFIVGVLLFILLIGVLAGIYPALVLSGLKSVDSLKGKLASVKESVLFRKTLVAFQFSTAAVVLIGAIIISKQVELFFNGDLGYKKDYLVYAQLPRDWSKKGVDKMESAVDQLMQMPQVANASLSYEIPDGHNGGNFLTYRESNKANTVSVTGMIADGRYASVYNIPLKAGSFFKPVYNRADSTQIVINQTEANALGWHNPADAVGQKVVIPAYTATPFTVCGVTADFRFGSMRDKDQPIVFQNVNNARIYRFCTIKLKPGNIQSSIDALGKKWAILLPGSPFEYHFMDDALTKLYTTEIQLKKAAYAATVLAVVIVLLGVLGLISLSVQKRTKEIGIRKVLGASVAGIVSLFLTDFFGVVIFAGIIACPAAYLIMSKWLSDYAHRIQMSASAFVIPLVVLAAITAILIVLQTINAAFANPVKSLRNE